MIIRSRLPEAVKALGGRPIKVAPLMNDGVQAEGKPVKDEAWLAVFADRIAVVTASEVEEHFWFECESASWNGRKDLLVVNFVDRSIPPFCVRIAEKHAKIVLVVRERLERSIVHRTTRELPSGNIARGLVRRDSKEGLFTQIFVDGAVDEKDDMVMDQLEADMREAVGMGPAE